MSNPIGPQLLMFVAVFAIFYFILIRPQQKERKDQELMQLGIKKGDEIVTAGGVVGDVVHVKTNGPEGTATLADRVTIRSGESRLVVERGRIARVVSSTAGTAAAKTVASGSAT